MKSFYLHMQIICAYKCSLFIHLCGGVQMSFYAVNLPSLYLQSLCILMKSFCSPFVVFLLTFVVVYVYAANLPRLVYSIYLQMQVCTSAFLRSLLLQVCASAFLCAQLNLFVSASYFLTFSKSVCLFLFQGHSLSLFLYLF